MSHLALRLYPQISQISQIPETDSESAKSVKSVDEIPLDVETARLTRLMIARVQTRLMWLRAVRPGNEGMAARLDLFIARFERLESYLIARYNREDSNADGR